MRDDTVRFQVLLGELSAAWAEFALGDIPFDVVTARIQNATAALTVLYALKGTEASDSVVSERIEEAARRMERLSR